MARKVTDISNVPDSYVLLSQTPKNYDEKNYFLKELQDKVDADWNYRFNRIDVDFEQTWGHNDYTTLEVVQQHVKSDTANAYTDDYRRLVFKNIREKRFNIGNKFRFMADNSISNYVVTDESGYEKNDPRSIWLVTNYSSVKATTSVIVTRCNGVLGNVWTDVHGIAHKHYEPLIKTTDLTATSLFYNQTAVSSQASFYGIVQHNDYTKNYILNQRFIIGYDQVYRIKNIDKFYGRNTNNPENVGLMKIYFEITEKSAKDDFVNGIAYQMTPEQIIEKTEDDSYSINIETANDYIPTDLGSTPFEFQAELYQNENPYEANVLIELNLLNSQGEISDKTLSDYVEYTKVDNTFTITRKKVYNYGKLEIKCYVPQGDSPTGTEISTTFKLLLMGL